VRRSTSVPLSRIDPTDFAAMIRLRHRGHVGVQPLDPPLAAMDLLRKVAEFPRVEVALLGVVLPRDQQPLQLDFVLNLRDSGLVPPTQWPSSSYNSAPDCQGPPPSERRDRRS
jgi:hypothetical protein